MSVKKSRVAIYIEFFRPQELIELEQSLRKSVKKKHFPAFRTLFIGIDYKGLRNQKRVEEEIPLVDVNE